MTLHLTLTHHWFDEYVAGRKRIEYRAPTQRWMRQIYERRFLLHEVCFHRGYTSTTTTFPIAKIDLGECPIPGWEGEFIRIHCSG